ncbi:MAG: hypothetical protein ACRDP1_11530 [Nocardioidaceae bacterium]
MRTPHPHRRVSALAGGALLVAFMALTGCGAQSKNVSDPGTATTPASTQTSPTQPATTGSPTTPAPSTATTPTATPPMTSDLTPALLAGATLPALNLQSTWRTGPTTPGDGQAALSICQHSTIASIGAADVLQRQFGAPDVSATQLVARFGDEDSAKRAYSVLDSWLHSCRHQIRFEGGRPIRVPAALTAVNVSAGQGGWSVVFYHSRSASSGDASIEGQALVRVGAYLSWVVERSYGQDYNYAPGHNPPELAIPLLADGLSALR